MIATRSRSTYRAARGVTLNNSTFPFQWLKNHRLADTYDQFGTIRILPRKTAAIALPTVPR